MTASSVFDGIPMDNKTSCTDLLARNYPISNAQQRPSHSTLAQDKRPRDPSPCYHMFLAGPPRLSPGELIVMQGVVKSVRSMNRTC